MYFLPSSSRNKERNFFMMLNPIKREDPLLFKRCANQVIRRCVPREKYDEMLTKCHSSPYGGQFGGEKTTQKMLQCGFIWPSLFKDCHRFVQQCDRCQRLGNITRRNEMP